MAVTVTRTSLSTSRISIAQLVKARLTSLELQTIAVGPTRCRREAYGNKVCLGLLCNLSPISTVIPHCFLIPYATMKIGCYQRVAKFTFLRAVSIAWIGLLAGSDAVINNLTLTVRPINYCVLSTSHCVFVQIPGLHVL